MHVHLFGGSNLNVHVYRASVRLGLGNKKTVIIQIFDFFYSVQEIKTNKQNGLKRGHISSARADRNELLTSCRHAGRRKGRAAGGRPTRLETMTQRWGSSRETWSSRAAESRARFRALVGESSPGYWALLMRKGSQATGGRHTETHAHLHTLKQELKQHLHGQGLKRHTRTLTQTIHVHKACAKTAKSILMLVVSVFVPPTALRFICFSNTAVCTDLS